jgi:integrator complex subunit 7
VKSSFDADTKSLENISRLQQICRLMIHVIDSILARTDNEGKAAATTSTVIENAEMITGQSMWTITTNEVLKLLSAANKLPASTPLTDQHISCIQQVAVLLARVRHRLPRYMFQRLQTTAIKLAMSPTPRTPDEPIVIHYDTRLTLKVEGIIQVGSQTKRFHHVNSVELHIHSTQQSRAATLNDSAKPHENPTNNMVETAVPHNDYFSVQFLLAFPVTGLHQVSVEASVIDASGTRWNTGPHTTFIVKSYDEAMHRHQQLQHANQPRHGGGHVLPPPPTRSTQPAASALKPSTYTPT